MAFAPMAIASRPRLLSQVSSAKPKFSLSRTANCLAPVRRLRPTTVEIRCSAAAAAGSPKDKAAAKAAEAMQSAVSAVAGAANSLPQIKFDISKLVRYNFIAQLGLAVVSWGVVFLTTHIALAKGSGVPFFPTLILMLSVLLSGYSAFLSFGYFKKVSEKGVEVLEGYKTMEGLFQHLNVNFVGAIAAVISLQAAVGEAIMQSLFALSSGAAVTTASTTQSSNLALECLTQAASNTLAAHLVSILFLSLLIRKISDAYKKLVEWSEKMRMGMPALS